MIQIENTILSEDLFEKAFVCDINRCKGACCVEGDAGAPLELKEIDQLENELENIKPYLTSKGNKSIDNQGVFSVDQDGDYVTTLNDGKECSFTVFDQNGIAQCGIEKAYLDGKSTFRKPASCHLYPIRISKIGELEALNYHHWPICEAACELGAKLQVKVYQFLKEPLIHRYGEEWYQQAQEVDKLLEEEYKVKRPK